MSFVPSQDLRSGENLIQVSTKPAAGQGSERDFRFVEGGFTLHLGRSGELNKPQILRSEWVGRRSQAFIDLAGHPHWHLDVLETARASASVEAIRYVDPATMLSSVTEFDSQDSAPDSQDLLRCFTVENMHLASAAMWWRLPSASAVHLPETVEDLDRWILGCMAYLRQEAGRCKIIA
jgi:hypothetical protein